MLNSVKKMLFEFLNLLEEAHEEIGKEISKNSYDRMNILLCDCQNTAVQMGELVDEIEGEGTKTVAILEKYCEELYQMSQNYDNSVSSTKGYKNLRKYIIQLHNSIRHDLPTKYEFLFLTYKVAMWDSMESVWKAATQDPDVDVYVVSIPYFDLKSDGDYGQMHNEEKMYPDYVKIHPWSQYVLEVRKPDVIIINNPYDDTNLVTRVHPDFFASNLKKYTDMLVYIPYFITIDNVEEHFCVLPGTIYADKVIVQSEKVRNDYLRYFGEWVKKYNYKQVMRGWEKKFIALGSPKFDKVMNTKREDCNVSEIWQKLILTKDGNRKKVVLYNTTIAALLAKKEGVLDQMEHTLKVFEERKDIVLLWRPHPLSVATYAAMMPHLLQRYTNMINRYVSKGWGIYDDTTDMNRAIAISDAYYGDWSSLVTLYKITGKPIMIQQFEE